MNRTFTNIIRFCMDELLPPVIRDSRWFMYPFYFLAYRGKDIGRIMNYKSLVKNFTEDEYREFYSEIRSISRERKTDLSKSNLSFILDHIDKNAESVLDVGCGNGYLLEKIKSKFPGIKLAGLDIVNRSTVPGIEFHNGSATALPFGDSAFDTVICTHTIEHLVNLQSGINELIRVAKKQLIIVTPCQRYFYYTVDEHINFFHKREMLVSLFPFRSFICKKVHFDWIYIGYK